MERRDYFEFDPYDDENLIGRITNLIDVALDYPDLVCSPNDRFSVTRRIPYWIKDEDTLIQSLLIDASDHNNEEQVATQIRGVPQMEIEIGVDIISRTEDGVVKRETVSLIDLTGTKVGSRFPVVEEFAFEPNGEISYTAGYQWVEKKDGAENIGSFYHSLEVDTKILQRFAAVLDLAYNIPDIYSRRNVQFQDFSLVELEPHNLFPDQRDN